MMKATQAWVLFLLAALSLSGCVLLAQEACQPPPVVTTTPGSNIFTEQQEIDLGDAMAQQLERTLRQTDDEAVTGELRRIGERLAKHLPPTQLKFRYFLVDLSVPQAFSISGGRIYVSRKMAAFVHNEDEMASVVGHEMGHSVTHQGAVNMTALLEEVLGVTAVSDRRDVFDKYNRLQENWRRSPQAFRVLAKEEEGKQLVADQVGLYALTAAGYSPQSFVDVFDRLAQTGGKTGGWLSDFFHTTKPNERRLREMLGTVQQMPQACVERRPASDEFRKWQTAVINYSDWDRREALHGVLAKVQLQPPLRESVTRLKFSPDGKYLLAQDPDKIYVLTVQPFAFLFDFDAPEARPAEFTPDSKAIVFHTSHLRVETWDVAANSRRSVYEPVVPKGCEKTALSPDGKTLACIGPDRTLTLMDVVSGDVLFQKESFATSVTLLGLTLTLGNVGFSPDGRYFLASNQDHALCFDIVSRSEFALHGALKGGLSGGFTFLGPDRVAGRAGTPPGQPVALMEFPSGKVLGRVPLGISDFAAATHGNYLLAHPLRFGPVNPNHEIPAVEVVDLGTGKAFLADKRSGLDIYDEIFGREMLDGEVGLYQARSRQLLAQLTLPGSSFESLHATAVSPDLKWLAASGKERGGVWNLTDGARLYQTRGFNSAWFPGDGYLYSDFPKTEERERQIGRFSLSQQEVTPVSNINELYAQQHGRFLVVTTPKHLGFNPLNSDVTREIRDIRTGNVVWSRHFSREAPSLGMEPEEGTMTLDWPASASAVEGEIKNFPSLSERFADTKDKKWVDFLEAISLPSGKALGALLIDTNKGSFRIADVFNVGDWVVLYDNHDQVLIYSLSTGEKKGDVVGSGPVVSEKGGLLCVRSGRGQLVLYDINSMDELDQFTFSSPIVREQFSQEGKRLFVLTSDQAVYFLDVSRQKLTSKPL